MLASRVLAGAAFSRHVFVFRDLKGDCGRSLSGRMILLSKAAMNRRHLFAVGAALLAAHWPAFAQRKPFRVGCLWIQGASSARPLHEAFLAGLRDHGYAPGRDLLIDVRYAGGDVSRLPALADELISLRPHVLVGVEASARAIRARTTSIPVVLPASIDPVATGLVRSLARPGVRVTGMAFRLDELAAKSIELLREVRPSLSRVMLLSSGARPEDISEPIETHLVQHAKKAAAANRVSLLVAYAKDAEGVRRAFAKAEVERPDGVIIIASPHAMQLRDAISEQTRRLSMPSVSAIPAWAEAGGLIGFGPDFLKNYRYAASFVDRILKGADAAEIPIEQPDTFQLVVNRKTAREIGVMIPPSILVRADRVID